MPLATAPSIPNPSSVGLSLGGRIALLLLLGLSLVGTRPAWSQRDTSAPPDSVQESRQPLRPFPFSNPLYGHPQTDSLPARLPHVNVETMLAEIPGSFLYDLGATGWPHGWSRHGLAPHRTHLWIDGFPLNNPLTGRPQFELLPPSFLEPPGSGIDPGGGAVGVHTSWRDYEPKRPVTELRYRVGDGGLHAVEVGHSQKRPLDLFGRPGLLHLTFGYGGRKTDGVYAGSNIRRERRVWGRVRYHTNGWAVELSDRASRYRIGAHGGVQPAGQLLSSVYALPFATRNVDHPNDHRRIIRNDLTARARAPLLPALTSPTEMAATWTSHTFDARTTSGSTDTTWTVRMDGGKARLRQSLTAGTHELSLSARGAYWSTQEGNIPEITGTRSEAHVLVRDSTALGSTRLMLDAGAHRTPDQWFPSVSARAQHPFGPIGVTASISASGQRSSWMAEEGFADLVQPLSKEQSVVTDRVVEATIEGRAEFGPFDVSMRGFAHEIQNALDLYAAPTNPDSASATADTVAARRTSSPVRRAGAGLSFGWRRDARRGLYATGHGTLLTTLNANASSLHNRLAQTLPRAYGRARIGARFVIFTDLVTDLYVQARGWTEMNSRWFHPSTGRLVVPPRQNPIPPVPGRSVGPSGTVDVHAEMRLRGATLFFTFQNVQAGTQLQPGTFVVPIYPLPAQHFRFGVFWPIFD